MPSWFKLGLIAVVIATILYVLISPLPELDAAGSIRSILPSAIFALSGTLLLVLLVFSCSPATLPLSSDEDILDRNCVRLC